MTENSTCNLTDKLGNHCIKDARKNVDAMARQLNARQLDIASCTLARIRRLSTT